MVKLFKSFAPKPAKPKPQAKPETQTPAAAQAAPPELAAASKDAEGARPKEIGGPEGPEPTRYGDWERGGRCFDF